jgi:hypothetical protein
VIVVNGAAGIGIRPYAGPPVPPYILLMRLVFRPWLGAEPRCSGRAAGSYWCEMPSLIRLLVFLGILSGFAYGAIFSLATLVEPKSREITVTIPQDKLAKPR